MRFPTIWYVRLAKPQISLRIRAVWSDPLQVEWTFYDCWDTDRTSFGVTKLKRRLHRFVLVYTCQNATLLEITCRGSILWVMLGKYHSYFRYSVHFYKVRNRAKIRNRYSQVPHLAQDINGKVTNSQLGFTNESQEVRPFPKGDQKANFVLGPVIPPIQSHFKWINNIIEQCHVIPNNVVFWHV